VAEAGASVAICDVNDTSEVVEEIAAKGVRAFGATTDITKPDEISRLVEDAEAALGPISGLVNNAAMFGNLTPKPFDEISDEEFRRVMDVNVTGVFLTTRIVARGMKARGFGRIVNISSSTVLVGAPYLLHYVASKGAVLAMTRSMARELGPHGIAINTVIPGLVSSENVKANPAMASMISAAAQRRSFQREQQSDDLIGAVIFFLSGSSSFVTGQSLIVDGGANFG
jgi:NAD(P)-dependent dehydrogenase (short-subunit alcohol dehydrogenase family)